MFDQRGKIIIKCNEADSLKTDAAYRHDDSITGKKMVAKLISGYKDTNDERLLIEFKKLLLLSGEPEIGSVYFLATAIKENLESSIKENPESSCYLMDFIEGQTLDEVLKKEKISFRLAIDLLIQITSGMEKAHSHGVFHHDLHENNIMIDSIGYVKIIDFLFLDIGKENQLKNIELDVRAFQKIVQKIFDRCLHRKTFKIILDYCNKIESFRNVPKQLKILEEICFDLSLMSNESKEILSILIYDINESGIDDIDELHELGIDDIDESGIDDIDKSGIGLGQLRFSDMELPKKLRPTYEEISEIEELLKDSTVKANHLIQLRIYLHERLNWWIGEKLHELKHTGFLLWDFQLFDVQDPITEVFKYEAGINITSKLIKWARLNSEINFLSKSEKEKEDLEKLIFRTNE